MSHFYKKLLCASMLLATHYCFAEVDPVIGEALGDRNMMFEGYSYEYSANTSSPDDDGSNNAIWLFSYFSQGKGPGYITSKVIGPCYISFDWNSMEVFTGAFQFYVDDERVAFSGDRDGVILGGSWMRERVEIGSGEHTLKWKLADPTYTFHDDTWGVLDNVNVEYMANAAVNTLMLMK